MKLILLSLVCFLTFQLFSQVTYSKVKVYADYDKMAQLNEQGVALDRGIRKVGEYIITDLSQDDIQKLQALNCHYEILIQDVAKFYASEQNQNIVSKNTGCSESGSSNSGIQVPSNFNVPTTYGGYYKYNEMLVELDKMATLYPHLISTKEPISSFLTWENRPIYHVKISNNPTTDDGDPMVLYTALHHSREPMSLSQMIFYMWYLLENYDSNPEVKFLVDNTQMIFVPCVNPDGYIHNETTNPNGGGMHRKNRNPSIGTNNKGVDINRNYGYGWGTTGVSTNQNNDTYPGTSAFSEPETQAMRWLVQNYPIRAALNAHTYGDMLLFPIGTTANEYADHHDYFQMIANYMIQYNGFEASKSSGLYPASGDSDDYMYKVDNGVLQKDTVFAMTPEIGGSFWPARAEIIPTCQEMLFVNMSLAHMVHKMYVTKENSPYQVETLTGNFTYTTQKLGGESGGATISIEPLLNIQTVGNGVTHNLVAMQFENGSISYTLNPTIQNGDTIRFVLITDDSEWIQRDTIVKIYGTDSGMEVVFSDSANNITNWSGNWATTSSTFYSAPTCFADSPSGNYQNNTTRTFALNNVIDLTDVEDAQITFYAKWDIEKDYDFCQLQVAVDGTNSWEGQCGVFTSVATNTDGVQPIDEPVWHGTKTDWVQERISLTDYIGQIIKIRFILKSDGGVTKDGFYFDDFAISTKVAEEEEPGNVNINEVEIISPYRCYPNPANESIVFDNLQGVNQIEIYDLTGKLVLEHKVNESSFQMNTQILSNGSYIVHIKGNAAAYLKISIVH